jgi:hypothetical protein
MAATSASVSEDLVGERTVDEVGRTWGREMTFLDAFRRNTGTRRQAGGLSRSKYSSTVFADAAIGRDRTFSTDAWEKLAAQVAKRREVSPALN